MNEFASNVERHRRELLLHCYRMLTLPDAEDAVQEALLRAWRYRDSLKEGAPLRRGSTAWPRTPASDAIARDERQAVSRGARRMMAGAREPEDVVWLGPIRTQCSNQPPRQRGHARGDDADARNHLRSPF